ncbi:MAG: Clp protease N-terminal domain-containing protein, partial [Phycisphaeraceae bacterium]
MDFNKLTQKTQEALHAAQAEATRFGHQEVDVEHMLLALVQQEDGLVPRLLQRMDVQTGALVGDLENELTGRPSVRGPGAEPGKVFVSPRLNQILAQAEKEAKRLRDEYVSVEHVVLAMLGERATSGDGAARKILEKHNINRDVFLALLTKVRGNQRVTSANPEETYEALQRYGRDL